MDTRPILWHEVYNFLLVLLPSGNLISFTDLIYFVTVVFIQVQSVLYF
jgi:hypothetical protein